MHNEDLEKTDLSQAILSLGTILVRVLDSLSHHLGVRHCYRVVCLVLIPR